MGKGGAGAGADAGPSKPTGPVKKAFFSPEESKQIQMSMNKFPKPDPLREAITTFQDGIITVDQIDSLHFAWPKESVMGDLLNTELEENESWDRAETYMLNVADMSSLYSRLCVWVFLIEYKTD